LKAYCADKGYTFIDQLQVKDKDEFYGGWKDAKKGKAKKLERLKGFVRFCVKCKCLTDNITEDLKHHRTLLKLEITVRFRIRPRRAFICGHRLDLSSFASQALGVHRTHRSPGARI
jgi:hypothetical protein